MPDATDRPLRRDAQRNRQRILEAARELFAEQGFGVTLNDVAHHAGVGVGTVYRRFPDKAHLIEELFEQQLDLLVESMDEALEASDPWQALTDFFRGILEFQTYDRALREIIIGTPEGPQRFIQIRERMFPRVAEVMQRAKQVGALRSDFDPADLPILILMLTVVVDAARDAQPELWRRYLEIVMQGLRADPTPPASLTMAALTPEQVPQVMAAFKLARR